MKTDFNNYVLYPPCENAKNKKLAYFGGEPVLPKEARKTVFPNTTKEDILQMLLSVSQDPEKVVNEFEKNYKEYVGANYSLATASGTSSLHLALIGVGVEPGDEVIIPGFTFIATAQAVVAAKAIPIFVDIDPNTFCIDEKKIEEKITNKTKVIMPVHVHGLPANIPAIREICNKYDLKLVEDASHAHSASINGQLCGSLGDAAGQSLMADKNFPVGGEGGMSFFKELEYYERAKKFLTDNAIDYEMSWIVASFGLSQLRRLPTYDKIRQRNAELLRKALKDSQLFTPPFIPNGYVHSFNMFRFHINTELSDFEGIDNYKIKEAIQLLLNEEGIFAREWQNCPIPYHLPFKNKKGFGNQYPFSLSQNVLNYESEKFPKIENMLNTTLVLCRELRSPIEYEKLLHYIEAIKKIDNSLDQIVKLAKTIKTPRPIEKDARLG